MSSLIHLVLATALATLPSFAAPPGSCEGAFAHLEHQLAANPLSSITTEDARRKFLFDNFRNGDRSFASAEKLATEVKQLPPAEQKLWVASIGSVYREMPKETVNPTANATVHARRLMDRAYALIARPDLSFAARQGEAGATAAFRDEITAQAANFGGNYGGDDVLDVTRLTRNFLREYKRDPMRDNPFTTVTLGGSFINGKARLGVSDIDVSIKSNPNLQNKFDSLQKAIDGLLASRGKGKLSIELDGSPDDFFGQLNTFAIKVTKDDATLLVFPPSTPSPSDPVRFVASKPLAIPLQLPAD